MPKAIFYLHEGDYTASTCYVLLLLGQGCAVRLRMLDHYVGVLRVAGERVRERGREREREREERETPWSSLIIPLSKGRPCLRKSRHLRDFR